MWHRRLTMILAAGLLLATAANPQSTVAGSSPAESPAPEAGSYDARLLKGIEWRVIGPFRGGRALAVTGVRGEPYVYYMGSVSGGVWKTIDGGETWTPLTDHESVSSIGSIAVPDS